jgi:hypothetical protein
LWSLLIPGARYIRTNSEIKPGLVTDQEESSTSCLADPITFFNRIAISTRAAF